MDTSGMERITVYVTPEEKEALQKMAQIECRSMAMQARLMITKDLNMND